MHKFLFVFLFVSYNHWLNARYHVRIVRVKVNTFYAWKNHTCYSVKLLGMGLSGSSQELRWMWVLFLWWLALVYHWFQFSSVWAALVLLWKFGLCYWMSFLQRISSSGVSCSWKSVPQLEAPIHILAPPPHRKLVLLVAMGSLPAPPFFMQSLCALALGTWFSQHYSPSFSWQSNTVLYLLFLLMEVSFPSASNNKSLFDINIET